MAELETRTSDPPITLTEKAIQMGKKKLAEAPAEEDLVGIRVGVRGGGCNGYSYVFDFANKVRPGRDLVLDFDGLTIVVDTHSVELLRGSTLDWEEKLLGYGFRWHNPNAKDDCGCGESFSV